MRKVMNEKRKSGKKLYKVAISLIKLSTILVKKTFCYSFILKLTNLGVLQSKILSTYFKYGVNKQINYVIYSYVCSMSAQKFSTRRSIKKFIKKRFQLH